MARAFIGLIMVVFFCPLQNGEGSETLPFKYKSLEERRTYYWHKNYERGFSVGSPKDDSTAEQWGSILQSNDDALESVGYSEIFAHANFTVWLKRLLS